MAPVHLPVVQFGDTALHHATRHAATTGSIAIVKLLIEHGAEINLQNAVTRGDVDLSMFCSWVFEYEVYVCHISPLILAFITFALHPSHSRPQTYRPMRYKCVSYDIGLTHVRTHTPFPWLNMCMSWRIWGRRV